MDTLNISYVLTMYLDAIYPTSLLTLSTTPSKEGSLQFHVFFNSPLGVQLVLPMYTEVWCHPLEHRQLTNSHPHKEN